MKVNNNNNNNTLPVSRFGVPILFLFLIFSLLWYNKQTMDTDYFPSEINIEIPDTKYEFKPVQTKKCRFDTCFDINRCEINRDSIIRIYVYPTVKFYYKTQGSREEIKFNSSTAYSSIISALKNSPFYTNDPSRACVFLPNIDTLVDSLNNPLHTSLAIEELPFWNQGVNHLIFSFLPSRPNSHPSISTYSAVIASPGLLYSEYRTGFDLSIPVYNFPERLAPPVGPLGGDRDIFLLVLLPLEFDTSLDPILLALQGQAKDKIRILDFCYEEARCVEEEVTDFPGVLSRAKFCLLLPGYRYGTPDLLDVLMQGCVPVYTQDNHMLPFEEVLDWRLIGVPLRPPFLPQVLSILDRISEEERDRKQEQGSKVYSRYFSSLGRIVLTALLILNERVFPTHSSSYEEWNLLETDLRKLNPLLMHPVPTGDTGVTAVVYTYESDTSLKQLIEILDSVKSIRKVVVIWNKEDPSELIGQIQTPLEIVRPADIKLSNRFLPLDNIQTDCVLSLCDNAVGLTPEDIESGYNAWREFPDRLVGYQAGCHEWNAVLNKWEYVSLCKDEISVVDTSAVFYHVYYQNIFNSRIPSGVIEWIDTFQSCEDVAMNMMVSSLTNKPPIKINHRDSCEKCEQKSAVSDEKSECLNIFVKYFGQMTLKSTKFLVEQFRN